MSFLSQSISAKPNCQNCSKPDDDDMVQCDDCDRWYHFACANVTAEVADHDWNCLQCQTKKKAKFCKSKAQTWPKKSLVGTLNQTLPQKSLDGAPNQTLPKPPPPNRTSDVQIAKAPSVTSKISKSVSLKLKMLEEERELQERRDRDYLNKKYKLLELLDSSEEGESVSDLPNIKKDRVEKWINQNKCEKYDVSEHPIVNLQGAVPKNLSVKWMGGISPSDKPKNSTPCALPQTNMNTPEEMLGVHELSKQQLAARQVMSKENLSFSGRPEEWPLFISWFESSTVTCGYSDYENLLRLQRCLKGKALDAVRCRLLHPSEVRNVISTLRMLYGRPEIIIQMLLSKIRSEPSPRVDKFESIINFSLAVQNVCSTMQVTGLHSHFNNPSLLQELSEKLPSQIRLNWGVYKQSVGDVNLSTFSEWLSQLAQAASEVTIPTVSSQLQNKSNRNSKGHINVHEEITKETAKCPICEAKCKSLDLCDKFVKMSLDNKWSALKRFFFCRICLKRHGKRRCMSSQLCGIDGCSFRHHQLLHKKSEPPNTQVTSTEVVNTQFNCNVHNKSISSVLFRIVPVTIFNNNNKINTFAFLDDGSSVTLIDDDIASALQVEGDIEPLCLRWTSNTHRSENTSRNISIEISAYGTQRKHTMSNVHTVKSLQLPVQSVEAKDLANNFKHLKNIPLESYKNARPSILIGLQHWNLGIPLRTRESKPNEPVATQTRLGWCVFGPISKTYNPKRDINYNFHICQCQKDIDQEMHKTMKEYFSIETVGTKPLKKLMSVEDEKAVNLLETKTTFDGERYTVPLLWKFENLSLPNRRSMAERRLDCLDRRLKKEPGIAKNLNAQMKEYVQKGYARKLNTEEIANKDFPIWYLPIFPVTNPNKPNKVRIVWDAAAKVDGISLNSALLTGPDNLVALPSILFRFREKKVAISADIKEMFHQVKIAKEDQNAQRFLWRNESTNAIEVYFMQVMTFGSTCSPSCAQFIKNKNAIRFISTHPIAAKAIINNHYVDDYLDSLDDENEAIKLAEDIIFVHSSGGFEIRNFVSNSKTVLNALKDKVADNKTQLVQLNSSDSAQKLLGMWWSPTNDTFSYLFKSHKISQNLLSGNVCPTKREVLKALMCVFDPLGLIAHFMVKLKILLQEIWCASVQWDEEVEADHFEKWKNWTCLLPTIKDITIRRPYFQNLKACDGYRVELHIFVDASESAYAAVAYFRISTDSVVECALVSAKTKVAPIKTISVPRMELEAAVLGTRLAKTVVEGHSFGVTERIFWSDSRTVLSWINSDHRKYKHFVAFRVGEILEETEKENWRWIPSKDNVADDATRWKNNSEFNSESRWYR